MMLTVVLVVVLVIAAFAAFVATRPAEFRIARSATVAAPPAAVFGQFNDLHAFNVWNPFAKADPNITQRYDGPPSGVGARFAWEGNKQVGSGRMAIIESRPYELIRMKLEFLKPFAATNTAEFTFVPTNDGTTVTWAMSGEHNFVAKAMSQFMNMDTMVGGQFEKGLADMKALVEGRHEPDLSQRAERR